MPRPQTIADLPAIVPLFPLARALLLPHTHRPLTIFEPRYLTMIDDALAGSRTIGMIQPLGETEESPRGRVPLETVGCLGRLIHFEEQRNDRYVVVLEGIARFEIVEEIEAQTPYRRARVSATRFETDFTPGHGAEEVDRDRFVSLIRTYSEFAQFELDWDEIARTETEDLVNLCCMLSPYGAAEKQALLEAKTLHARAETLIAMAEMEMARASSGPILQ